MSRTLAELVASTAPMTARRAAALMVPITAEVRRLHARGLELDGAGTDVVVLHASGDVELRARPRTPRPEADVLGDVEDAALGATLGRWYFELLMGRAPLDRTDAFEPTLTAALGPRTCSLLARSLAEHPPQWPGSAEWSRTFERLAGGWAPPEAPTARRDRRRSAIVSVLALIVLAALSLAVLWAAPRWWDAATSEDGAPAGVAQLRFDSS